LDIHILALASPYGMMFLCHKEHEEADTFDAVDSRRCGVAVWIRLVANV
jgi:hypothetical protein